MHSLITFPSPLIRQGSMFSLLVYSVTVDAITRRSRENLMNEILYADNFVLMSEMESLRKSFENIQRHMRIRI